MDYAKAIEYTHSLLRFGSRPGLDRIRALLCAIGNPEKKLRAVHVAGTNGKGSVCAMLSSICKEAGLKTGLFISPYILDFRERIQIDGAFIPKQAYAEVCTRVKEASESLAEELRPTEFEFVTAAALLYFAHENCDIVILETGLGGRLDSTNVWEQPLVTVITSISKDHMAVLGDTLSQIAAEKCGILKPGRPLVTTPKQPVEAMQVIDKMTKNLACPIIMPQIEQAKILSDTLFGSEFIYQGLPIHQPLAGCFQLENTLLAIEAARLLPAELGITGHAMAGGIAKVSHPARFEVICKEPLIILDGAHNDGGAQALRSSLDRYLPQQPAFGDMRDAARQGICKGLSSFNPSF